jgi:DNA-binding winged helix-turn-helix (wHTH) protein
LEERNSRLHDQPIRFLSCELDPARRRLLRDGHEVHVTPKAFDLLKLLVHAAPRVVSKRELHERLWPRFAVSDATLFGLIKELRRALADSDSSVPLIRTVHRVGYGFNAGLEPVGPPPRQGRRWLVVGGDRFGLAVGENVVGRDPDAAVFLDDTTVSRRHARILVGDTGAVLEDLGSKNGTSVGDARLRERIALHDGDQIVFGDLVTLYRESTAGQATVTRVGSPIPRL